MGRLVFLTSWATALLVVWVGLLIWVAAFPSTLSSPSKNTQSQPSPIQKKTFRSISDDCQFMAFIISLTWLKRNFLLFHLAPIFHHPLPAFLMLPFYCNFQTHFPGDHYFCEPSNFEAVETKPCNYFCYSSATLKSHLLEDPSLPVNSTMKLAILK